MRPSQATAELDRLKAAVIAQAKHLEHAATGTQVWRVAGPDGAYAIEFSRDDTMNPKAECELWIHEHPEYAASRNYSVQEARRFTQHEQVMLDVAARLRIIAA